MPNSFSLLTFNTNTKIGAAWSWSMTAGPSASCPGASAWCRDNCYATKGSYRYPNVERGLARRFELARSAVDSGPGIFAGLVLAQLRGRFRSEVKRSAPVRIHASGDFFSAAYVREWAQIAREEPERRFWTYTRSYHREDIRDALEDLYSLPNVSGFASVDPSMRIKPPKGWRVAEVAPNWEAATGTPCPALWSPRKPSCTTCRLCVERKPARLRNVSFIPH